MLKSKMVEILIRYITLTITLMRG